ncbi:MAG: hypothetical protein R3C28_26465 [Pirellulaceae bacterium]
MPFRLLGPLRTSMQRHFAYDLETEYQDKIHETANRCQSNDFNDIKDYLYLNIRVARFIFSLGYFKELANEVRRPFLTAKTIDAVCHLPRHLRLDKAAYITMLCRYMPELMRYPWASVSSVPNWNYLMRTDKRLKPFLLGLLETDRVATGEVEPWLDRSHYQEVRDCFFQRSSSAPKRRYSRSRMALTNARRAFESASPRWGKWTSVIRRSLRRKPRQQDEFDFLRRVALVTLLQENLTRFKSGNRESNKFAIANHQPGA